MKNQAIKFTYNGQNFLIDANRNRGFRVNEGTRNGKPERIYIHDNSATFAAYRAAQAEAKS